MFDMMHQTLKIPQIQQFHFIRWVVAFFFMCLNNKIFIDDITILRNKLFILFLTLGLVKD